VDVKRLVHIVRGAPPPAEALADHDWVVYVSGTGWRLDPHGAPPVPPGSIDDDQLLDLVHAADTAVVW
jgi:hypothetical protein